MRKFLPIFFITIFSALHANAIDKDATIVSAFLEKNGWELSESKMSFAVPSPDIVPIHFFSKGAKSPSCGLLVQKAGELSFTEILMTEPDDQYPQCASIKDAASFKLMDRSYLLFVYTEKETRDEMYDRFFFIYRDQNSRYLIDRQLNESNIPVEIAQKNSKRIGPHGTWYVATADDGIRLARSVLVRTMVPNMEFLDRDFISGRESSFSVLEDTKRQKCLFVVENGGSLAKFSSDLFTEDGKCIDFLASSKTTKGDKTYFLGIFEGAGKSRNITVFSVDRDGLIRDERELALMIRSARKASDIKSAKAHLHEIAR